MAFTYDISTDLGKVRLIIGDTDSTAAQFQDEEISAFLLLNDSSLLLASADALDAMAAKIARGATITKLGDYQLDTTNAATQLQAAAEKLRDREYNTPAFGIVEDNVSGFNELEIIRNYLFRTLDC
jgi:hypothetical protein